MVICCLNNNLEINWKSVLVLKKSTSTLQLFNWNNTKPCSSIHIFKASSKKHKLEKIIANCFIQYWFAITSFLRKWRHNNTCAPAYAIKMAGVWFRVMPPEPEEDKEFTGNPGPKNMPPRNSSPLQYFLLFFNLNLIREVVRQTNRYFKTYEIYPFQTLFQNWEMIMIKPFSK